MISVDLPSPSAAQVEGSGQLLDLIRTGRATTVSEMAASLGVARSTIAQRLGILERWGLVGGEVRPAGARGRPAATTGFRASGGSVLAAHVGMTGYRAMLTDLAATPLADRFVEIGAGAGPTVLVRSLAATFDDLLRSSSAGDLIGIGIGIPGPLELRAARNEPGEEWDLQAVASSFVERFDVPVALDRDVSMLALAEQRGSWPDADVLVCLKLGTSIDAAILVRGEPLRGLHGLAGELGHLRVAGQDAPCTCGSRGCLEAIASGAALVRRLRERGHDVDHVREVVRLAAEGTPEAMLAVRHAGRDIGSTLASVVTLLNPGAITAWGYLTESELLFAGIREALHAGALPGATDGLELQRTALGPLVGARGAALRAIDEVLAPEAIDRVLVARSWSPSRVAV